MPVNSLTRRVRLIALIVGAVAMLAVAGCGDDSSGDGGSKAGGEIAVDGSSTVYPFAQAAAELFKEDGASTNVTVGESGTGGGFEKFCAGETDISNASREIKPEEVDACKKGNVEYLEVKVAADGIAVVTNPDLKVDCLTVDQLKTVWNKGSKVGSLKDVDASLPDGKLSLFGPGTDSGTFDFFTDVINGEEGATRKDYQPSEDDNVLVQGVSGDPGGLGYFGFSYYEQNTDKLNLVGVDGGAGCVKPSKESIQSGEYKPLARPLFMYVSKTAFERPEVKQFMEFAIKNNQSIADAAKIVPMSADDTAKSEETIGAA